MQLPSQKSISQPKPFWQKQMPTILGLGILLIALSAGLVMFGSGTGVFAPRATPQTTPKQVKITNVGDKAFTVSFYTDEATAGFVKYGTSEADLKSQASDDRDQLTGSVAPFHLHHISVKGLKPGTNYFFSIGTGSGSVFDNNGAPFTLKTASDPGTPPPAAKTVYGTLLTSGGTPADGSIVYLVAEGGNELSALVKSSGSWAISLANARNQDKTGYLEVTDSTPLTIFVQGTNLNQSVQANALVSQAQPLADLSLIDGGGSAKNGTSESQATEKISETASNSASVASSSASATSSASTASSSGNTAGLENLTGQKAASSSASSSAALKGIGGLTAATSTTGSGIATSSSKVATAAASVASPSGILNLEAIASSSATQAVVIAAPIMVGKAKPNVSVKIEVHSETAITQTVTADASGNFQLDISQFKDLEPGEHTVTYSYIDPTTGQEISKTQTFTVPDPNADSQKLAMAESPALGASSTPTTTPRISPTVAPYGSGNPYPITSPTAGSTKSTDTSTRSAVVSTTSGSYKTGNIGNTIALVIGGSFLMAVGLWSWWLAGLAKDETS